MWRTSKNGPEEPITPEQALYYMLGLLAGWWFFHCAFPGYGDPAAIGKVFHL